MFFDLPYPSVNMPHSYREVRIDEDLTACSPQVDERGQGPHGILVMNGGMKGNRSL